MKEESTYGNIFYLPCLNDYFLEYIFPDIEVIKNIPKAKYDINSIIHKRVIIFSAQGSGKTQLVRSIAEDAIKKYGARYVNAVVSTDFSSLILHGLNNKLVQILFCDDFSLERVPDNVIKAYFRIRHIWRKKIKRNYGLIVSIFALHRFHSSIKEIRSTADVVIIRDDSLNPYDHSLIKQFIGNIGLRDLHLIQELRDKYPILKSYSIFRTRTGQIGLIFFPLARKNYLKKLDPKYSTFEKEYLLSKINSILE